MLTKDEELQEAVDSAAAQFLIELAFAIPKGDTKQLADLGAKVTAFRDAVVARERHSHEALRARVETLTLPEVQCETHGTHPSVNGTCAFCDAEACVRLARELAESRARVETLEQENAKLAEERNKFAETSDLRHDMLSSARRQRDNVAAQLAKLQEKHGV